MFTLVPFTHADKTISINGPNDLRLYVEYDDVDYEAVERAIPHLMDALNSYWQDRSYTFDTAAAAILGRKGGQSTSKAKQDAAKKNGKKGGRPKKVDTDAKKE